MSALYGKFWERWSGATVKPLPSGQVQHLTPDGISLYDVPTDYYFSLTYASWLAIPRLSLREMPADWQARFYTLLDEGRDVHGLKIPEGLVIQRTGPQGRFVENSHWNDYRRGTVAGALTKDASLGLEVG